MKSLRRRKLAKKFGCKYSLESNCSSLMMGNIGFTGWGIISDDEFLNLIKHGRQERR